MEPRIKRKLETVKVYTAGLYVQVQWHENICMGTYETSLLAGGRYVQVPFRAALLYKICIITHFYDMSKCVSTILNIELS